jgi:hypothetical protein
MNQPGTKNLWDESFKGYKILGWNILKMYNLGINHHCILLWVLKETSSTHPTLHSSTSPPNNSLIHNHRVFIHIQDLIDFLGAHESLECKLGNIFWCRSLVLPSLTIYFLCLKSAYFATTYFWRFWSKYDSIFSLLLKKGFRFFSSSDMLQRSLYYFSLKNFVGLIKIVHIIHAVCVYEIGFWIL